MLKKLAVLALSAQLLVMAGCGEEESEEVRFGKMLGEVSCLTAETDGQFDESEAEAIAANYGFEDWSEEMGQEFVAALTDDDKQIVKEEAVATIESNCQAAFDAFGVEPELMVDLMLGFL